MGNSYSQADLTKIQQACGVSQRPSFEGYKQGGGRSVFVATGGVAIGAVNLDLVVPKGSVLFRVSYKVLTTFASATSAATIALSVMSANDIKTAIAINNGANPWTAASGDLATVVIGATFNTHVDVTADSNIVATVAVEALTAGKLVLWADWAYYGDLTLT